MVYGLLRCYPDRSHMAESKVPDFKGIENLHLVLFFIVPGLITVFIRSRFIAGRKPSHTEQLLSYLVVSLVYYTITLPYVMRVLSGAGNLYSQSLNWAALTLFGPAIFGIILGAAAQKRWMHVIAGWCRLSLVDIIPTAWDYRFSNIPRGGIFVLVMLSDDRQVAGFFGSKSFASSESEERDLYIEEEVTLNEDGSWAYRDERVGILVSAKEIKHVEFYDI